MFELEFYKLQGGVKPVEQFILELTPKMQVKALDTLEILQNSGNKRREPYSKPIKDGIFDLRIQFANDISRIFYFFYAGEKIVLTNGFVKKTNKTPQREINRALKYKEDYERSKMNE